MESPSTIVRGLLWELFDLGVKLLLFDGTLQSHLNDHNGRKKREILFYYYMFLVCYRAIQLFLIKVLMGDYDQLSGLV